MIRSLAERLSSRVVLRRKLPEDFGGRTIYVSPSSALRFWLPTSKVDPGLFDSVRTLIHGGDVVWDVGANVGLSTFAASARAGSKGRVLAIEPDHWLVELLHRSSGIRQPECSPVTVLPVAVSDRLGTATLNIARRGRAANFISGFGSSQSDGARESFTVLTVTLDWLLENFPAPTVLKIDVECCEHLVLRGARKVLTLRPRIICEVARENAPELEEILHSAGYRILNQQMQPVAEIPFNIMAIPV